MKITNVLVKLCFVLVVLAFVFIPFIVREYLAIANKGEDFYLPLTVVLYCSLIPASAALFCLDRLISNIGKEIIFENINVKLLRVLSWCCFAVCILYTLFAWYYLLSLAIAFAAGFIGLILRVVKNVFEKAIEIKEENDYTI